MNIIQVKQGNPVVRQQDKVMEWYLIQEGSVVRKFNMAEVEMGPNSIIGILEHEWFSCDYIAKEDTSLIAIPCKNAQDLHSMLKAHENFRPIFLRTALLQRHEMLSLYGSLLEKCTLLHNSAESFYDTYLGLCADFVVREESFDKIERFAPISIAHKADDWEIASSTNIVTKHLKPYMQLMIKDDALCVGSIMECSAQMRRVTQGIEELANYLRYNREILASDSEDDIFHLFLRLASSQADMPERVYKCKAQLSNLLDTMNQLGLYDKFLIEECESMANGSIAASFSSEERISLEKEDTVTTILEYAGYEKQEIREFKTILNEFKELPDWSDTSDELRKLRKLMSKTFYDVYEKAFLRAAESEEKLSPVLSMFFNFGFIDVELCGMDNANTLLRLTESLDLFQSSHVYTIYDWLVKIYRGEAEPSRNEFDTDYKGYLAEAKRVGDITEEQFKAYKNDNAKKVEFEIRNMFQSGHRVTYGRITTFCPFLIKDDIINTVEKMALTASYLENTINKIRQIDYSAFYREIGFSDTAHGINQEWLMHEILPDIILMPGVGTRAMMWQETASVKNDTPARFLFPILTAVNMEDQMMETVGRYRWEICRKIQGLRWNDIRDKSLTSEYCDYLQFYRKNKELSAEAKEKLGLVLKHHRNNYREVFVADYVMWLKYESQGSFRLNRLTRGFLVSYCPFSREIRENLSSSPAYQNAFHKLEVENGKKVQRFQALYTKYEAAGGEITDMLSENLRYYYM